MQILLSLRYHIYKVYKPCTNYKDCNIYISYIFYKNYIVYKLKLTVMEEDKMPLWKKLAMEKGLIPEETDSSSGVGKEVGKEEKDGPARTEQKSRPAQRRYCTMRVYADSLPALRRYATFSGNENARSYAEILDALLGDLEKTYQVINEILAQKRKELLTRNGGEIGDN